MKIAVAKEIDPAEPRVAASPDTVKKFKALGVDVAVEPGAGVKSGLPDSEFTAAGATVSADAVKDADVVIKVKRPEASELGQYKRGAAVIAIMDPYGNEPALKAMADAGVRHRLERGVIAVRIHDGDHRRAALVLAKLGSLRPLHFDDDIGILDRIGADAGTNRGKFGIRKARLDAGSRLDRDIHPQRLELLDRIGRGRYPRLSRINFLGNGNFHKASGSADACARNQTSVNLAEMDTGFATSALQNFSLRRAVARNGFWVRAGRSPSGSG